MRAENIHIRYYAAPCGELILGAYEHRLCLCDWVREERRRKKDAQVQRALQAEFVEADAPVLAAVVRQLDEYFRRERTRFDVPLHFVGTDFQQTVWRALLEVPYGATESYGALARRLGNPKAVRAVAAANGANLLSIIVPCHRIIGSNQQLTGYAGGLSAKQFLLSLEQRDLFHP